MPTPVVPVSGHDKYFDDTKEEGVVATFDYQYELKTKFKHDEAETGMLLFPCCWICLPFWYAWEKETVKETVYAQHVCITRDGIKHVIEARNTGWGWECERAGKESKTIPFDKITDCDIEEPAGTAVCCWVPNVLTHVNIDTASSSAKEHELVISGLKDPQGFKSLVWAMKRGEVQLSSETNISDKLLSVNVMDRMGEDIISIPASIAGSRAIELLSSIDRRIAEQTELLRQIAEKK